jgi:hypothetical protein
MHKAIVTGQLSRVKEQTTTQEARAMRNRKVQNELKRQGFYERYGKDSPERKEIREERLSRAMENGISDPTPWQAVDRLIAREKAMIKAAREKAKATV